MVGVVDRITFIIAAVAAAFFYYVYLKTGQIPWGAAGRAGALFVNIVPKIAFAFLIGALLTEVIPREIVQNWLSDRSGGRGILLGWLVGGMMPSGAPFVILPIAAGLLKGGAGIGPTVAMLTSTALFGPVWVILYEIPIMGSAFFFTRLAGVIWIPPIAGFIAQAVALRFR